jgi:hypothetical protein
MNSWMKHGWQGRISRGIHGLPKVLLGPAMPYHSMPCCHLINPLDNPSRKPLMDVASDRMEQLGKAVDDATYSHTGMSVWKGVAMDSLKYHSGPPCPTLLCLVSGPTLKQLYDLRPSSTPLDTPRRMPLQTGRYWRDFQFSENQSFLNS